MTSEAEQTTKPGKEKKGKRKKAVEETD